MNFQFIIAQAIALFCGTISGATLLEVMLPRSDGLEVAASGFSSEVGSVAISRRTTTVFQVKLLQLSALGRVRVENCLYFDLVLSERHDKLKWTP